MLILIICLGIILSRIVFHQINKTGQQDNVPWISAVQKHLSNIFSRQKLNKKTNESIISTLDGIPRELYTQAQQYQSKGRYNESLPLLIEAHQTAEKVYGSDNEKTNLLLFELAKCYKILGRYSEASSLYVKTLESIAELGVDSPNTSAILDDLTLTYMAMGDFASALPVKKRAISIEEKSEDITKTELAQSIGILADICYRLGQLNESLSFNNRALELFEQAQASAHPESVVRLNNIAIAYIELGDNEKALPFLQRALSIQQQKAGNPELINGLILNNMSLINLNKGQYLEASLRQKEALAIYNKLEPEGSLNTAATLGNLAKSYQAIGKYKDLLSIQERIVTIDKKILGDAHIQTISAMINLAVTFFNIGKFDQASSLFQSIDDIYAKNSPTNPIRFGAMLMRGGAYYKLGDYKTANNVLNHALELSRKTLGSDSFWTNMLMGAVALTDLEVGRMADAEILSNQMIEFFKNLPQPEFGNLNTIGLSLSLFLSSKVKLAQDKPVEALPLAAKSLALDIRYPINNNNLAIADRLHDFSKIMYKINPLAAIAVAKAGINMSQALRLQISELGSESLQGFTKSIKYRYQFLSDMLTEEGRLAEAQQVLDLLKLNELYQYTRGAENNYPFLKHLTYNNYEQSLIDQYKVISNKIANQNRKFKELSRNTQTLADKNLIAALVNNLNGNQEVLMNYLNNMATSYQNKTPSTEETQTPESQENLKQIQEIIKASGPDVALLQYYLTEDKLGAIITGSNYQLSRVTAIDSGELPQKIASFNKLLRNPNYDPRPAAQELYKLIFEPIVGDLENAGAKTVMLSLDSVLRYIPFAALHNGKQYLVEKYRLPIYTATARDKLKSPVSSQWQVSAMGVTKSIRDFPALPDVRAEVEGIVRHGRQGVLPGQILLDKEFTREALQDSTKQSFQVLHIASHFVFSPGTEINSFLLMGDGQELTLADIRTQNFDFSHVDLLTLSACETGLGGGVDDDGREIEGFGAIAQRQGAKSVLATLWPVADQSTAILMKDLYRLRQEKNLSKGEALRQAQLALLNGEQGPVDAKRIPESVEVIPGAPVFKTSGTKPYAHPFYWAPFILMGNWK